MINLKNKETEVRIMSLGSVNAALGRRKKTLIKSQGYYTAICCLCASHFILHCLIFCSAVIFSAPPPVQLTDQKPVATDQANQTSTSIHLYACRSLCPSEVPILSSHHQTIFCVLPPWTHDVCCVWFCASIWLKRFSPDFWCQCVADYGCCFRQQDCVVVFWFLVFITI